MFRLSVLTTEIFFLFIVIDSDKKISPTDQLRFLSAIILS